MTDQPYPDNTLSEETRQMIEQKQLEAWKRIFDTVMTPPQRRRNDHYELAKRVRLIAADLSLSGEQETANVLYEAAEAIAERP